MLVLFLQCLSESAVRKKRGPRLCFLNTCFELIGLKHVLMAMIPYANAGPFFIPNIWQKTIKTINSWLASNITT